jgi:hypothetical protein
LPKLDRRVFNLKCEGKMFDSELNGPPSWEEMAVIFANAPLPSEENIAALREEEKLGEYMNNGPFQEVIAKCDTTVIEYDGS